MTLRTVEKIGAVTIRIQSSDKRYYLVYRDTAGKRLSKSTGIKAETEKQLAGITLPDEVKKMARELRDILGSRFSHVMDRMDGDLIGDAIRKAITHARAKTDDRRADLRRFEKYFINWLEGDGPNISYWEKVTGAVAQDYVKFLHDQGLKPKSIRHYIGVLTMTAKNQARSDPRRYYPLVIQSGFLTDESTPEKNYINADQVALLWGCANMRVNRAIPRAVVLGCLVGCNIKEIIRLRVGDFDFTSNMLSIKLSKNKYRARSIPILPAVSAWMAAELSRMAPEALVVTNTEGFDATHHSVGLSLRRLLNSVAADFDIPAYADMDPKDVRKTFVNLCVKADVALSDYGAYIGHAPAGMTDKHYAELMDPDRLRRVVINRLALFLEQGKQGK